MAREARRLGERLRPGRRPPAMTLAAACSEPFSSKRWSLAGAMRLNKRREPLRMADVDHDAPLRLAAFEHVRRLGETHEHLTATKLKPGFVFEDERVPLMNPHRGIFKPRQMRFLLSIRTVFPRPGARVWYDDQREVHRQLFEADETVDYALYGPGPGRRRQSLASRGVRAPDTHHLFPRYRTRPLPGHGSSFHCRVGRHGVEGACRVRCTQSGDTRAARERAGTEVRLARG